ncbi:MAG: hypothetical protein HY072_04100, partial [Deltaproteobacteria bacterium]|nr:hypothetical protein [Deltaproteobacteria bacterium]
LLFPIIFNFVSERVTFLSGPDYFLFFIDLVTCIFLIGFPTALMGSTLPLLTQGLSMSVSEAVPVHARIYATNTAGAFVGCLIGGFFLLPSFGLPLTMMYMAVINLVGGLALLILGAVQKNALDFEIIEAKEVITDSKNTKDFVYGLSIAFIAGFNALSLQTLFMRIFALSVGASEYAFCVVVAVYILMLAVGAYGLTKTKERKLQLCVNQTIALIGLFVLYFLIPYFPYGGHLLRTLFVSTGLAFYVYFFATFLVLATVLAIPIGSMGRTMPLLLQVIKSRYHNLGSDVGRIYAWNTIGCVGGALVGGFFLLYFFNMDNVFKICLLGLSASVVLALILERSSQKIVQVFMVCGLVIAVFLVPNWDKKKFTHGLFRYRESLEKTFSGPEELYYSVFKDQKILAYWDDPNTTAVITEFAIPAAKKGPKISRSIIINGKSDGSTYGDLATMSLAGHLPGLFQKSQNQKTAVIGFGTGVTVGSLSLYDEIKEIHVMEISPAVKKFAPFFDFANHGASKSEKLEWHMGDAFRVLGKSQDRYGAIISEPSNPWVTGIERLYTLDFYQRVFDRLDEFGIYVQWIHTYEISYNTVGLVINTFSHVFPNIRIFIVGPDLIMLGTKTKHLPESLDMAARRFELPKIKEDLEILGLHSVEGLLSLELPLSPALFQDAGVHTLEFPRLTYQAGKDFFKGLGASPWAYLQTDKLKGVTRLETEKSLIKTWFDKAGDKTLVLKNIAQDTCGQKKAQFFQNW